MFTLHFPFKLEREIIFEKYAPNTLDTLTTAQHKTMNKSKIGAHIVCIISAITFSFIDFYFIYLNFKLFSWNTGDRVAFLVLSIFNFSLISPYCRFHNSDINDASGDTIYLKIQYLSLNWFKRLFSIFIIFFLSFLFISLIIGFCSLDFNVFNITNVKAERTSVLIPLYVITILTCVLSSNNVIKLFKIEK